MIKFDRDEYKTRCHIVKEIKEDIKQLQQENEKLKKKLNKYESPEDMTLMYMWCTEKVKDENKKLKNQQKEFIKYLEEERERCLTFYSYTECAYAYDVFTNVLAKYKEIIGGEDENK